MYLLFLHEDARPQELRQHGKDVPDIVFPDNFVRITHPRICITVGTSGALEDLRQSEFRSVRPRMVAVTAIQLP